MKCGMKVHWKIQIRYKTSLEAPPRFFQRLFLISIQGLFSSITKFPGFILSSCVVLFVTTYRQLSNATQFIQEQRDDLNVFGAEYLWFLYLPIYWFTLRPVLVLAESLGHIFGTSEISDHASHVPTFYAPDSHVDHDHAGFLFGIVLPFVMAIFGAIHFVAWQFYFPSYLEQVLWRIGSVTITALPSIVLFSCLVGIFELMLNKKSDTRRDSDVSMPDNVNNADDDSVIVMVVFAGPGGMVLYMFARLLLITLTVVLLRKQPESAFYAVNWSVFLPHI